MDDIEGGTTHYLSKDTKEELSIRLELTMRYVEKTEPVNIREEGRCFIDTEQAIINSFEKKDKK